MNTRYACRAFTLTECVACLAVGGLLVMAVVPLADRAREQSRIATCLSNMRTIAQGAHGYVGEYGTIVFAWPRGYYAGEPVPSYDYATEFIWGGAVPDTTRMMWNYSWGFNPVNTADVYSYRPALRPLNDYLVPGVWWDDPERIKGNIARYRRPMILPDFFKCPSDTTPQVPNSGAMVILDIPDYDTMSEEEPFFVPTWKFWGNSYASNWYWARHYAPTGGFFGVLAGNAYTGNPGRGAELFTQKLAHGASEFVLFMENRLNFALGSALPRGSGSETSEALRGWHRGLGMHVAAFADGAARYRFFDHRYVDGPGWSIWPNRPWDQYWDQWTPN